MDYFLSFLEGIITFISPCLLPMLPVYLSFFAGQKAGADKLEAAFRSIGFVLGFTVVFVSMGAFAGTIGRMIIQYSDAVNLVAGIIIILFGLHFMGLLKVPFLNRAHHFKAPKTTGIFQTFLFGIVFSIGWTPCVGVFLGSALMLAATTGESVRGIFMLLCFSLGLGIPFVLSAVLIDRLKTSLDFIKRHYRAVTLLSGGLLVLIGLLTAAGFMKTFLSFLTL